MVRYPNSSHCFEPFADPAVEALVYQVSREIVVGIDVHLTAASIAVAAERSQSPTWTPSRALLYGITSHPS